jgi:ATP-dependent Clp protease ATP-binding subunit ClpC
MDLFPQKIQNKFTSHLKDVIKAAENISRELSHESIGIEHIILGVMSQKGSAGSNMLGNEKLDLKNLHKIIDKMPRIKSWRPKLSDELENTFKKTVLVASKYKHTYIGTEHLLYAILASDSKKTKKILYSIGINHNKLKEQLKGLLESSSRFSEMVELFSSSAKAQRVSSAGQANSDNLNSGFMVEMPAMNPAAAMGARQSALECFCTDLVREFEEGNVDLVVGREEEISKLVDILNRKTKSNPVLVGEPGVGKTAVVQGLAQRISEGDVPASLLNKRIYSLDLGLLVAGTVFRGEFEARLKDVIGEAEEDSNVIMFIDEIHTIIGAGSTGSSGSLDAANILKPSLSRGSFSCIGATTLDEYRKHFRKDAALERRFQTVLVEEPSVPEAKKILQGLKSAYEKHHNLAISDEAVEAAVDLSQRFINDRFLPDKAFDFLDEAAALVRSRYAGKNYFKEIKILEEKKRALETEKEKAIENEKYDEALKIKGRERELEKSISNLYEVQEKESKVKIKVSVTAEDVAEVIKRITGIPVKRLIAGEREKLKNLQKMLARQVIGQEEAIDAISRSVRRSRLGVASANRPLGVFMFLGPTGVGKTELAKVLARVMYEKRDALIKVDMSEFMERHNVSRLVGAPAGYVGYEEGGKLTEQVRLRPYSIVLFDEIEKAHPDVFNLLLQIFEDGELTDAAGRKIDFKNTIVIMTSNIGTNELTSESEWGFSNGEELNETEKKNRIRRRYIETKEDVLRELKEEFNPEFLNRIDKILIFNPLGASDIKSIVKLQFNEFKKRLFENNGIKISIDNKAVDYLSQKSFNPNEGARLVRRNLQEMVEDLISEKIMKEKIKNGNSVVVSVDRDKIVLK